MVVVGLVGVAVVVVVVALFVVCLHRFGSHLVVLQIVIEAATNLYHFASSALAAIPTHLPSFAP